MNYNRGSCRNQRSDIAGNRAFPMRNQFVNNANESVDDVIQNGKHTPLSTVYSPVQEWRNIFDEDTGLKYGTIFAELNLPFAGYKQMRNGGCSCER